MAPKFSMTIRFICALICIHLATSQVSVNSCQELREVLEDLIDPTANLTITIIGRIVCNQESWGIRPVHISGDITIRGTEEEISWIDWESTTKAIIASPYSKVTFHNIVLLQEDMGIGGLDIQFFETERGAEGLFAGVVFTIRSCLRPIAESQSILQGLPRPLHFPGNQVATTIENYALKAVDIGVAWYATNSTWHICYTIFICKYDDQFLETFKSVMNEHDTCPDQSVEPLKEEEKTENSTEPKFIVLIILCVLILMILIVSATCYASRQVNKTVRRNFNQKLFPKGSGSVNEPEYYEDDDGYSQMGQMEEGRKMHPLNLNFQLSDVEVSTPLGKGEFGRVFKGSWQGTTVAVKIIRHNDKLLQTHSGEPFEAFLSKHISHPNVVQTYHIKTKVVDVDCNPDRFFNSPRCDGNDVDGMDVFGSFSDIGDAGDFHQGPSRYETWIVLEYCDRGSLLDAINTNVFLKKSEESDQRFFKMSFIARTALDIASAMNYLHSVRIIHGDLKPGNVLIIGNVADPREFICKVGDFGVSRFLAEDSHINTFTHGTVTHMPPELLKKGLLTSAADVYSFAILLWEILSGEKPHLGKNPAEVMMSVTEHGRRPEFPPNVPKDFCELIEECWHQDYFRRPNFASLIDRLEKLLVEYEKIEGISNPSPVGGGGAATAGTAAPEITSKSQVTSAMSPLTQSMAFYYDTNNEIREFVPGNMPNTSDCRIYNINNFKSDIGTRNNYEKEKDSNSNTVSKLHRNNKSSKNLFKEEDKKVADGMEGEAKEEDRMLKKKKSTSSKSLPKQKEMNTLEKKSD